MRTNTDICNMSLSYIAKSRINSLADNTEEARQCKTFYDHCRQKLLREHNFGFAKRFAALALLDVTVRGWKYAYAYPANCLSIRYLYTKEDADTKTMLKHNFETFKTSDGTLAIACNIKDALIEYTADELDSDIFTVDFVEALSRLLASYIALPLTGNSNIADMQYQLFATGMQQAKAGDFYEQKQDPNFPTGFSDARF